MIGPYLDQLEKVGEALDMRAIQGSTKNADRRRRRLAVRRLSLAAVAPPALLMLGGALLGACAKAADEGGISWLSDLGSYPAFWLLALAVVARLAPTVAQAAGWAGALFFGVCVGYYTWSQLVLGFGVGRYAYAWTALAVTLAPAVAAAGRWAVPRRGLLPGLVVACTAAAALSDGLLHRAWLSYRGLLADEASLHPVQLVVDVLVAAGVAVLLPRDRSTRVWAAALLLPAGWVAGRAIGGLQALLPG